MARWMNIGEAAAAAGVSPKMIRHYEQIGLVPEATRTESGYRQYSEREVSILRFIRQSRQLGFSIEQIAELLGLWSDRSRASREVKALARSHLDALNQKMRELAQMQSALERLVASCHGDDDPHCAILEGLAVHSPEAPPPGAVGAKPVRMSTSAEERGAHRPARATESLPGTTTYLDLMAWTRAAHDAHGRH
ncbi:Cu(I)-responsive transcriptional regulator [uncultured Piscinibacter sp.]|uniref:Cu(I)-responsive transcriptional regulator n=1 Tax=uncultured Piscinibacter sp. TaxID=1131835 RepID=UPI00345B835D